MSRASALLRCVLLASAMTACAGLAGAQSAAPQYRLAQEIPLPGDDGWDYLTVDASAQRLFVSHGTHVTVVATDTLQVIGEVPDTPGVHGIALAPELGRAYASAGRAGTIVMFDLKTLARLREIRVTGENPDAILYDGATRRVFTFNGHGRNVTAVDAQSGEVQGTIALDAAPEFAVSDGAGHVYVNLEDRNSIAVLDARALKVSAVWPIAGCEAPSGLALDKAGGRLFPVCENKVMAVIDARDGHELGTAPIGAGVDAAAFDPGSGLAFASCGEGVLTVVRFDASGKPAVAQSLATRRGARTLALDTHTHRVYLVTADFGPAPAPSADNPRPRPTRLPGTFRLLVVSAAPDPGAAARP
jgi:DNA-binding beta-propeller fold protein YncE